MSLDTHVKSAATPVDAPATRNAVTAELPTKLTTPATAASRARAIAALKARSIPIFHLAIFFGFAAGLGGAAFYIIGTYVWFTLTEVGENVVWMAPLGEVILFGGFGLVLALLARVMPRLATLRWAVFILSFLCYASILLRFNSAMSQLHPVSIILLSTGLATGTTRLIVRRQAGFRALLRWTLGWTGVFRSSGPAPQPASNAVAETDPLPSRRQVLVSSCGTLAGLAVGYQGFDLWRERRTPPGIQPAPPNAPNVLLLVLDTTRAQSMGLYGYQRPTTPQLQRLAATGVNFRRALSAAPWTLPSHASMFTGCLPYVLKVGYKAPLNTTYPTVAEAFTQNGYATAGFVANWYYCCRAFGLSRGFSHYEDYPNSAGQVLLSTSLGRRFTDRIEFRRLIDYYEYFDRLPAATINQEFLRWLDQQTDQRPFFAFLNYGDSHMPYLPPPPFDTQFGPRRQPGHYDHLTTRALKHDWVDMQRLNPEQLQAEIDAYDGTVAYLDQEIAGLLETLESRGLRENTVIVITADHGEHFGEHKAASAPAGLFGHGNSLYLPLLHVPLLILGPGRVPAGKEIAQPVSLVNLAATLTDLANLRSTTRFPGESLARHWEGIAINPAPLISQLGSVETLVQTDPDRAGGLQSVILGHLHYIRNVGGREELYDCEDDAGEERNLARTDKGRQELKRFREMLDSVG